MDRLNELNEQQKFIRCLHHANHNSFAVRLILKGKGRQFSSCCLDELESYDCNYDTYISLHGFSRYGRKSGNIRELTCIYFDLDIHQRERDINEYVNNTVLILKDAFAEEILPEPTIITRTGRGLGIFYVLERSIACSKDRNAGQVEFWELIYRNLGKKIEELLIPENNQLAYDPEDLLEFDSRILCDYSRVTRLPMTVNQATGERCSIISMPYQNGQPRYYSLKELSGYVFSEVYSGKRTYTKRKKNKNKLVYVDFSREIFLRERLRAMELLQGQRKGECTGVRDYMCFVYYNHAVQVYGIGQAVERLNQYNDGFNEPLPAGELSNLVKGVNRNKGDSYKGHYRLTNKWIVEKCGISQEEEKQSGMRITKRSIDRIMAKETTVRKRIERNRELCAYVIDHPKETYRDIAKIFGISLRTLQGIVKAAGIHRYHKSPEKSLTKALKKGKCQKCKNLSHSICCDSRPMVDGVCTYESTVSISEHEPKVAIIDTG